MTAAWKRAIGGALLGAALLLSAGAHAADALVPATDLHADGQQAQRQGRALVLLFSLPGCQYCEGVRRNYLLPLTRDGAAATPLVREAELTSEHEIAGFDGAATTPKKLAEQYHVRVAPTVLVLDGQGRQLAAPIVGGDTSGFYGGYLDNALDEARRKLK